MNITDALDIQLSRIRSRYARTSLPRFFSWWGRELAALLPQRWRALLAERSDALLLQVSQNRMRVWRHSGTSSVELGQVGLDLPAVEQKMEFARLRDGLDDPNLRQFYCLDANRALHRKITMPAAAEDNLRRVLSFEMDRQTPFKADQVYFDYHVAARSAADRNLHVELTAIPRTQLDAELAAFAGCEAQLDGVDCWSEGPGSQRMGLNLLPSDRRYKRTNLRLRLNLALGAAALVLLVTVMLMSLANRESALEAMRKDLTATRNDATQVANLRKTLQDTIDAANFLSRKKQTAPLMVELLNDLTKRLPDGTFLERMNVDDKNRVDLQGLSDDASKLIGLLQQSKLLTNPTVQGTIQPDPRTKKDRFNISVEFQQPAGVDKPGAKPDKSAASQHTGNVHASHA